MMCSIRGAARPWPKNRPWAGSPGWDPAGARGRRPASGAASGRVRPRSGIRVWQTSNISLGSGMVRRGVTPKSDRIRRGLGTRVLLTCLGPADPRYWGGLLTLARTLDKSRHPSLPFTA